MYNRKKYFYSMVLRNDKQWNSSNYYSLEKMLEDISFYISNREDIKYIFLYKSVNEYESTCFFKVTTKNFGEFL